MKRGDKVRITRDHAVEAWDEIKAGTIGTVAGSPVKSRGEDACVVEMSFESFPPTANNNDRRLLTLLAEAGDTLFVYVDALELLP